MFDLAMGTYCIKCAFFSIFIFGFEAVYLSPKKVSSETDDIAMINSVNEEIKKNDLKDASAEEKKQWLDLLDQQRSICASASEGFT